MAAPVMPHLPAARGAARPRRFGAAFALALVLLAAPVAAQTVHLAVIVGLAGDPEDGETFRKWADSLVDTAPRLGVSRDRIIYLADAAQPADAHVTGHATKTEIERAFATLASRAAEDDVVFVVLIGHGTSAGRETKFNLRGPDMTPQDFVPLLKTIKSQHVVFVDTTSASGPFLETLAGPGRTIVTATRTGSEHFTTLFGGYFVDAFTSDAADADKNGRVSVLEAFNYARTQVKNAYEREGVMITEHALLDDSGEGKGTMDPSPEGKEGRVAAVLSLGSTADAGPMPDDPQLRALYTERRDLERRMEALKLMKGGMDPARYATELEKLATALALKTREIRQLEGKKQ
jgi:hypothetical protein